MLSFTLQRQVHLALDTLPDAGVYTTQSFFDLRPGLRELVYWIKYTAGAAGGYPSLRVQWGNGVEECDELVLDRTTLVVTAGLGAFKTYLERIDGPIGSLDADYVLPLIVPYGATKARLLVAEKGVTATPGDISVAYTGGTGAP